MCAWVTASSTSADKDNNIWKIKNCIRGAARRNHAERWPNEAPVRHTMRKAKHRGIARVASEFLLSLVDQTLSAFLNCLVFVPSLGGSPAKDDKIALEPIAQFQRLTAERGRKLSSSGFFQQTASDHPPTQPATHAWHGRSRSSWGSYLWRSERPYRVTGE